MPTIPKPKREGCYLLSYAIAHTWMDGWLRCFQSAGTFTCR